MHATLGECFVGYLLSLLNHCAKFQHGHQNSCPKTNQAQRTIILPVYHGRSMRSCIIILYKEYNQQRYYCLQMTCISQSYILIISHIYFTMHVGFITIGSMREPATYAQIWQTTKVSLLKLQLWWLRHYLMMLHTNQPVIVLPHYKLDRRGMEFNGKITHRLSEIWFHWRNNSPSYQSYGRFTKQMWACNVICRQWVHLGSLFFMPWDHCTVQFNTVLQRYSWNFVSSVWLTLSFTPTTKMSSLVIDTLYLHVICVCRVDNWENCTVRYYQIIEVLS